MNHKAAKEISLWRYSDDLSRYNGMPQHIIPLMYKENHYHYLDFHDLCVGFFGWGEDTQVLGYVYDDVYIDIGLGMNPQFVGLKFGEKFFLLVLQFIIQQTKTNSIRLTVVSSNSRAIYLYKKCGFVVIDRFLNQKTNDYFFVMIFKNFQPLMSFEGN